MGNDRRGGDSWGYYTPKTNVVRDTGDICPHLTEFCDAEFLMFHTRKATVGKATKENAHPFECGKIIGAHNGSISNHASLNEKYKRGFEVDSKHIFAHINEGLDMGELSGYGAIEFLNKDAMDGIHLCKLSGGELSIHAIGDPADREKVFGVVWSSDKDHVRAALKMANVAAWEYDIKSGTVYKAKPTGLYKTDQEIEIGRSAYHSRRYDASDYDFPGMHTVTHNSTMSDEEEDKELDRLIEAFKLADGSRTRAVAEDTTVIDATATQIETAEGEGLIKP